VIRIRDGKPVAAINIDLSAETDITKARRLNANLDIAYMGDTKGGKFDIDRKTALALLSSPNPGGSPGSDVVLPWINGLDVTRRHRDQWLIDFGTRSGKGGHSALLTMAMLQGAVVKALCPYCAKWHEGHGWSL
jgi:hypothetical protein